MQGNTDRNLKKKGSRNHPTQCRLRLLKKYSSSQQGRVHDQASGTCNAGVQSRRDRKAAGALARRPVYGATVAGPRSRRRRHRRPCWKQMKLQTSKWVRRRDTAHGRIAAAQASSDKVQWYGSRLLLATRQSEPPRSIKMNTVHGRIMTWVCHCFRTSRLKEL